MSIFTENKHQNYMKKILFAAIATMVAFTSFAQDNNPLRLAVAGVTHGHLGEVASRVNRGDFVVVGVAEENDEYRAKNSLSKYMTEDKLYKDLGEMLDATKPEVVVAYGPIADHIKVVEACAPRHINVMVEKPLATTYKDALKIAELAKKYGIMVLTNYETTWYNTNHHAKKLVESGEIGDIDRINVYDGHQGPKEIGCDKKFLDWLTDPVLNGGGAVIDFGCYGANLATWIMGNQKPESVYAVLQQNKPSIYPKVDDDATIVLKYPGVTVQAMGSWCWPMNRKDMYIYGSKGYIYQRNGKQMSELVEGKAIPEYDAPKLQAPYDDSFRFLKAAVRHEITVGPDDLSSLENNLIVVQILEAAVKSGRTGKPVYLK